MLDNWEFTVLFSLWVEIWGFNLNFMQALIYIDSEMQTGNVLNTSQNGYCLSQLAWCYLYGVDKKKTNKESRDFV